MRNLISKLPLWKITALLVVGAVLLAGRAHTRNTRSARNFGNYGNYNAVNQHTCGLNNNPWKYMACSYCTTSRRRQPKQIKQIRIGGHVSEPGYWNKGKEVFLSIEGGMEVKLKLANFGQSVVNEVQSILFKDVGSLEVIYAHTMTNYDIMLTGSSKRKLHFIAPSLTQITGNKFHSKREWEFPFLIEILTWDDEEIPCQYERKCRLIYSFAYTPIVDYLSNTVALAQQDLEFRIIRNRGLEIKSRDLALKEIKITDLEEDVEQNCDFKTFSQITAESSTSMYGHRQYSCKYNGMDFFHDGAFNYQDYVGKAQVLDAARTYDYDGSSFEIRILPGINSVSTHTGFRGSGLDIVIKGTSFMPGRTKFYIAGQECEIVWGPEYCPCGKEYTAVCTVPEVPEIMESNFYVGNHGWNQDVWYNMECICSAQEVDGRKMPDVRLMLMNAESPYNHLLFRNKRYVSKLESFFHAPKTGKYRFWLTASQEAKLYMNDARPNEILSREDMKEVLTNNKANELRNLYELYNDETGEFEGTSEWMTLTSDDFYHMQLWHDNGALNEHFTLGVEIENDEPQSNSRYEIQRVQYITPAWTPYFYIKLQWENLADNHRYSITFDRYTAMSGHSPFSVDDLSVGMDKWQLKVAFRSYIQKQFGNTDFTVTRTKSTTQDGADCVEIAISFPSHITGLPLYHPILTRSDNADKSQTVAHYHQGTGGFSGKSWKLEVYNPLLEEFVIIDDLPQDAPAWRVEDRIASEATPYHRKLSVQRHEVYKEFSFVGYEWVFTFPGFRADIPQFRGININIPDADFRSETLLDYSTNIFLYPIPYSMTYAVSDKPQLTVEVDGHLGACNYEHNWKDGCNFMFEDPVPKVTSFWSEEPYTELTVNGDALDMLDYRHIKWAGSKCQDITITPDQIVCRVYEVAAGKFRPKINVKDKGNLKVPKNMDIVIDPKFTFSPDKAYTTGGRKMIITLTRAPEEITDVKVMIGEYECLKLKRVRRTTNQLKCRVPRIAAAGMYDVKMIMNEKEIVAETQIEIKQFTGRARVDRKSRRGAVEGDFDIMCGGVGEDLSLRDIKKFHVYLRNKSNQRRVRMKTRSCNYDPTTGDNTVTVWYPGCTSGKWDLVVEHDDFGEISDTEEEISVGPEIESVSPLEGSLYGGTQVTITGQNFEEGVSVMFNRLKCEIISLTETEIKCYSPPTFKRETTGEYAEAQADVYMHDVDGGLVTCPDGLSCVYSWKDELTPEISATSLTDGVFTCMGRGFPEDMDEIEVKIGGRQQRMQRVFNTNQFSCEIVEYESSVEELDVEVRTRRGGRCRMMSGTNKMRAPGARLRGLSRTRGSKGGCRMRITGDNFTKDRDLLLVNEDGEIICDRMEYIDLKTMECKSRAGSFTRRRCRLRRRDREPDEPDTDCEGEDCDYETDDSETPVVTSCSDMIKEGNKDVFTITGTGFTVDRGVPEVEVGTKKAAMVTVLSETEIKVEFEGVGFPQNIEPSIIFLNGDIPVIEHTCSVTVVVPTPPTPPKPTSGMLGGSEYEIEAPGLGSDPEVKVKVCGFDCPRDMDKETSDKIVCTLPPMHSVKSVETTPTSVARVNLYNLDSVSVYSSLEANGDLVFDGDTSTGFGQEDACYVGLKITTYQRMNVQKIRYYLEDEVDRTHFFGAKFEGSVDGQTWETLHTISQLPTDGWNSVDDQCTNIPFNSYIYVRFSPSPYFPNECTVAELQFFGNEMFVEQREDFTCNALLYAPSRSGMEEVARVDDAVTYSLGATPKITGISERYVSWRGGDEIVIDGENFGNNPADVKVLIDEIECEVSAMVSSQIKCITQESLFQTEQSLKVVIKDKGTVDNQGHSVKYVCYFSDEGCWSNREAPGPGDSLYIPPEFSLVIDVDEVPSLDEIEDGEVPYLQAVVVEGSLIFEPKKGDDTHHRYFSAGYIIVREGTLEIGTEENPYTSNLEITLYGEKKDPQLPLFGNKVIGLWEGRLDIHGRPRTHTWVELAKTARKDDEKVTLNVKANECDWTIGDEIVIASTSFEFDEAEKFTITSLEVAEDPEGYLLVCLNSALLYDHYAGSQDVGANGESEILRMHAEVGLLTHNVKIQGDESSLKTRYGGHIMLKGNLVKSYISNIELKYMGQAYQVDRHPITYTESEHLGGSYVYGTSIWDGFNRAVSVHVSNCMKVQGNVAYNVMGHNFFLQEGLEMNNSFIDNLAVATAPSHSLMNTDQTPASFWITSPNNHFIGNRAAGSDTYGFWFDLPEHSTGSSESEDVCPQHERLGSFIGNVAHSNGRYGVRIYPTYIPTQNPCEDIFSEPDLTAQEGPEANAFSTNPPVPAVFENILVYKNERTGIIAESIGALQFKNIVAADNVQSGIEITLPGHTILEQGFVDGALIVGFSENMGDPDDYTDTKGIVTGQRDSFTFRNIKFRNFNLDLEEKPDIAAIATCSHCPKSLDGDGFFSTQILSGLSFRNVLQRLKYSQIRRTIIHNPDGSLIEGNSDDIYVTPTYPHLVPHCTEDASLDDSVVCSQPIRKLIITSLEPTQETEGLPIKVALQADVPADGTEWTEEMHEKFARFDPRSSSGQWEVPFLVGQEYHVHWRYTQDWKSAVVKRSRMYELGEPYYLVNFNYTDRRDVFEVASSAPITNVTAPGETMMTQEFGKHKNDLEKQLFQILVNPNKFDAGLGPDSTLAITTMRCAGECGPAEGGGPIEETPRYWSVAASWDVPEEGIVGAVPGPGDSPIVRDGWNMIYDVPADQAVPLKKLEIRGRLTFHNPEVGPGPGPGPYTLDLRAEIILVETGELIIGTESDPYRHEASITLLGEPTSTPHSYSNDVVAGNKLLFVTGKFTAWGKDVMEGRPYWTRLTKTCVFEESTIWLEPGLNWMAGYEIAIAPTSYDENQHEKFTIVAYDNDTGETVLNGQIQYMHYGAANEESFDTFTYDLRAEVILLTRNVKIQGDGGRWGGQILVTEWEDPETEILYAGEMTLKYVEMRYMAQYDTINAAIRLTYLGTNPVSVTRSSIHDCEGIGIYILVSSQVVFNQNVIYRTRRNGAIIRSTTLLELCDNVFIANQKREWSEDVSFNDYQAAVDVCVGELLSTCKNMRVQRNIVAGATGVAFTAPAADCTSDEQETKTTDTFKDNQAHSVEAGLISMMNNALDSPYCGLIHNFKAHHCQEVAVMSRFNFANLIARRLVLVDNKIGAELGFTNGDNPNGMITLKDSLMIGEHEATVDCAHDNEGLGKPKLAMVTGAAFAETSNLPYMIPGTFHAEGSNPTRGKSMEVENVIFKDYNTRKCGVGKLPQVINLHSDSADMVMHHTFRAITLHNVQNANFLYLANPLPEWASLAQCGEFPCTGRKNVVFKFEGGVHVVNSNLLLSTDQTFTITSANAGIADDVCLNNPVWNANVCEETNWALLQFESLDSDSRDRSVQPIYITSEDYPSFNNKLNSFMDHASGYYEGQKRMSRFVSAIRTNKEGFFEIAYTGTPPMNQVFELYGAAKSDNVKVRIDYTEPKAVRVYRDGIEKAQNEILDKVMKPLVGDVCGENRWDPVNAVLEFTIQGGDHECSLELKTLQSIQLGMRLEMTLEDFYSNNGELTFLEKLARQLNISRDRIKIVGIWQGSVVLKVMIEPNSNLVGDTDQATELNNVSVTLQAQVNNGTLDVGAPLLDFEIAVSTHPQPVTPTNTQTTTVLPEPQPQSTEETNMIWPITIMVSSACVMIAAVILLVLFIKKTKAKMASKQSPHPGAIVDADIFKKVWPESMVDSTNLSRLPPGSSDRELQQKPVYDRSRIDRNSRSSVATKVEEI